MLTPLRGLLVPRIFKGGVSFSGGGRRLYHQTVMHLFGWVYLVVYVPRRLRGMEMYKPRAIAKLSRLPGILIQEWTGDGLRLVHAIDLVTRTYIGTPEDLVRMLRWGVRRFEPRWAGDHWTKVCCIGWDPKRKKWHGWSHRARKICDTPAEAEAFAESVT